MESFFGFLFVIMLIASVAGGIILAIKWVKNPVGRVLLALLLMTVFAAAGTTAVIAGCVAVDGPPNFH